MKVYLETMGCQMNQLDSELVLSALRTAGHDITDDAKDADVVLYNTCSVRRHAENKVYSRLGAQSQRKATGLRVIVGVLGCMAQREGEELRRKHPCVDLICAPGQLQNLPAMIAQAATGQPAVRLDPARDETKEEDGVPCFPVSQGKHESDEHASTETRKHGTHPDTDSLDLSRDPSATRSPAQAYVRVSRGCDNFCSYCIVPFVRGAAVSRDPAFIREEVKRLVEAGRSEITLLGQTVNSYAYRNGGRSVSFADLLALLSPIAGLRRLRFVTSHPVGFTDDVLQAMRDLPNVCPYLHVPAQSGSDPVLARMNRHYTRAQYDDLIDRARAIVPGVVIAGDFIVGFPGETEADHEASRELIRRSGYKNSFIFKYSPRPGTAAVRRFTDDVPMEVKKFRNNDLLAVQAEVGLAHHRSYIGRTLEVLVDGQAPKVDKRTTLAPGQSQLIGRSRGDHIVAFPGPLALANQYMDVQITDATGLTLFGQMPA